MTTLVPRLRRREGPTIPLADVGSLRPQGRRHSIVRVLLAAALCVALLVAFLLARSLAQSERSTLRSGGSVVVLDLSASIDPSLYGRVTLALNQLSATRRRTGLVLFSSEAYEALPLGSQARELRAFTRFFKASEGIGLFSNPWALAFRGGTRISAGLEVARDALLRAGIRQGQVLLISDLVDNSVDPGRLAQTLLTYEREGIDLRVLPLTGSGSSRSTFADILGEGAFVKTAELGPETDSSGRPLPETAFPLGLALVAAFVLALLAVNEHVCARLEWGERREKAAA